MPTHTTTFDIPQLVTNAIADLLFLDVEPDDIKPETPLADAPLFLDVIDIMYLVQEVSQKLVITVTFDEEDTLNAESATVQTAIDLFTKLYNAQHPTQ